MQSQDFDIIATHPIDGDVVLVQDPFTGTGDPACPAHAAMKPAISSTERSAVLVHLKAIDHAPYLANTPLTCPSVANSPASDSLMPS